MESFCLCDEDHDNLDVNNIYIEQLNDVLRASDVPLIRSLCEPNPTKLNWHSDDIGPLFRSYRTILENAKIFLNVFEFYKTQSIKRREYNKTEGLIVLHTVNICQHHLNILSKELEIIEPILQSKLQSRD